MAEQLLEAKLPKQERVLTEVDHLMGALLPSGDWDQGVVDDVLLNLKSAVQEGAMPYAVTEVRHQVTSEEDKSATRTFRWLGQTAVQSAMSGYRFHHHPSALKRVDVEVDEARYAQETQQTGSVRVFISPRMTRVDASQEDAENEHLADDDAVRISWLETDEHGVETERVMQSLLVRNIPLDAWVAMLRDPGNVFGKSITIEDEASALSVMKVHRELELPSGMVQSPVDIVEAVAPYIEDEATRLDVERQIEKYQTYDQDELAERAAEQAADWLEFEKALAESMVAKEATYDIRRFIVSMQEHWTDEELAVIHQHDNGGTYYRMSRELAIVLEGLKQNVVLGVAGAATGNEKVIAQLSPAAQQELRYNQEQIAIAQLQGLDYQALTLQNQRLIAGEGISVGGGCPGTNDRTKIRRPGDDAPGMSLETPEGIDVDSEDRSKWKWKKGVCEVKSCSTRPGETKVGPCSVCEKCQAEFDRGNDPTKQPPSNKERATLFTVKVESVAEQKAEEAASDKTPEFDTKLRDMLEKESAKRELVSG